MLKKIIYLKKKNFILFYFDSELRKILLKMLIYFEIISVL